MTHILTTSCYTVSTVVGWGVETKFKVQMIQISGVCHLACREVLVEPGLDKVKLDCSLDT